MPFSLIFRQLPPMSADDDDAICHDAAPPLIFIASERHFFRDYAFIDVDVYADEMPLMIID